VEGLDSATVSQDAGVLGVANLASVVGGSYDIYSGVWAIPAAAAPPAATRGLSACWAPPTTATPVFFLNNSADWSTLYVYNAAAGGTGLASTGVFNTLMVSSRGGTCGIGSGGSLSCTGPIKSLASAGSGARTVETYGVQSPENWMEDFGTGQMEKGVAVAQD